MFYINWKPSRVCAICTIVTLITGCSTYQQHLANLLIGKNVDDVYAQIGRPTSASLDSSDPTHPLKVQYWKNFHSNTQQDFVQTGSAYAGQTQVAQTSGGNGVAGMPIYQNQYVPTGYYQTNTYPCSLTLKTDRSDTVVSASTDGVGCIDHLWWAEARNW
ncbi:hypothetical protein ACVBGC_01590 [Burkholderia stagnalis]